MHIYVCLNCDSTFESEEILDEKIKCECGNLFEYAGVVPDIEEEQKFIHVPNTYEILANIYCEKCENDVPYGESIEDYSKLEVGYTELGLQIWCQRCNANVIHIAFNDSEIFANTSVNTYNISKMTN